MLFETLLHRPGQQEQRSLQIYFCCILTICRKLLILSREKNNVYPDYGKIKPTNQIGDTINRTRFDNKMTSRKLYYFLDRLGDIK